jgi:hypothetical protein
MFYLVGCYSGNSKPSVCSQHFFVTLVSFVGINLEYRRGFILRIAKLVLEGFLEISNSKLGLQPYKPLLHQFLPAFPRHLIGSLRSGISAPAVFHEKHAVQLRKRTRNTLRLAY